MILLYICTTNVLFSAGIIYGLNSEGQALISLLSRWEVPKSLKQSWNSSQLTPCSWVGVQCEKNNVVLLNLPNFNISGPVGPEIGQLVHLHNLTLRLNSIFGSIPNEISNCTLLEVLDLSGNNLTGKIPENLGTLQNLQTLYLNDNSLMGNIPESLFQIPNLELVYLYNNHLSGSIPTNLGNVTQLEAFWVYNNQLSGTIPPSIGNCSALTSVYLDHNHLTGVLPPLHNLEGLIYLSVHSNSLDGTIPSSGFGSCTYLKELDLARNLLSGDIPLSLSNCTSMTMFSAKTNKLTGTIPSSFGVLTNLSVLYLSENSFSGKIPSQLGNCKFLTQLFLNDNKLEGEIPSEFRMLTSLVDLRLYNNSLTGKVPLGIWKIQSLEVVLLYNNRLSGELPVEITELKKLKNLTLADNQFSGVIPQALGINSSFLVIDFTNNKFTGVIPPHLCFNKQLQVLDMGSNMLSGSIPPDLGSCSSLIRLRFEQNNLTGTIPEFKEDHNLYIIDLSGNTIHGKVPSSLGNCHSLSWINFTMNDLSGSLPPELGNLTELGSVFMSHNKLEGPLQPELGNWRNLLKLDLSFNSFNGSIPESLGSLAALSFLDLSENRLTGGIPPYLSELQMLQELHLGANLLEGSIPSSITASKNVVLNALNLSNNRLTAHLPPNFQNLASLQWIDVSHNNLSGSLEALANIPGLDTINVSYNHFSGPIPSSLLKLFNKSPSSFLGNPELCIDCTLYRDSTCTRNEQIKICSAEQKIHKGLSKIDVAMIILGSSLFAVLAALATFCVLLKRRKQQEKEASANERSYTLRRIMESTGNLDDQYIIGRGAHGTVYKAVLGSDEVYAVKKLVLNSETTNISMTREIETLGQIKHRNLVKLKNFWLTENYGLILYEYMENGSLGDFLNRTNTKSVIRWDVRYKIALGTAHGLAYLHFDCDPPILHRDIKPENILLDSDLEPHISDFGIAKLLDQPSMSTKSLAVPGTIGYIAPENAYSTTQSWESDVYSYGVLLLEILTRKVAVDASFPEGMDLVGWVKSVWNSSEHIDKVIDVTLIEECQNSKVMEQVYDVFIIALRCTEREPRRRPTMRDVVKQLENANRSSRTSRVS